MKIAMVKLIFLETQKRALREFPFDPFLSILNEKDRLFVEKFSTGKKYKQILQKGYLDYESKKYLNRIKYLQDIIINPDYPWFAMIDILTNQKQCMEKYVSN